MSVLILGFDGYSPDLAFPWARAGHLPNLARMMKAGAWGSLRSVVHPITPAAWKSMITGTNPGRHGIYDFGARREGEYSIRLVDSRDCRVEDLFDAATRQGRTVLSFNVPLSFPPKMVLGQMVTGMHTTELFAGCFPTALAEDILDVAPDYTIDVMSHWYEDMQRFRHEVYRMLDARRRVAMHLWQQERPDLAMIVFVAADRIQHALWRQEGFGSEGLPESGDGGEILRVYRALDEILGDYLDALGPEDTLLLASDHGFGSLDKDVYLDRYLAEVGLLCFHGDRRGGRAGRPRSGGLRSRARDAAARRFERWWPARPREKTVHDIDWSRTRAYAQGVFGNVFVNLAGREPRGIVREGPEYHRTLQAVADALADFRDPDDGQPVVDHVFEGADLYRGEAASLGPDLVIVMRNYAYMTRGGKELSGDKLVGEPAINHSGNHRLDGCIAAVGPAVIGGREIGTASIMDVYPTVLALLGLTSPHPCDGLGLVEAFDARWLDLDARPATAPAGGSA